MGYHCIWHSSVVCGHPVVFGVTILLSEYTLLYYGSVISLVVSIEPVARRWTTKLLGMSSCPHAKLELHVMM